MKMENVSVNSGQDKIQEGSDLIRMGEARS